MSASDRHTDTHTDRQIHADENNTSPKTKFLGEVKNSYVEEMVTESSQSQDYVKNIRKFALLVYFR